MAPPIGIAKAPGSCGELVQGTLNGESFHISCPIDLYSQVKVVLNGRGKIAGPPDRWKTKETIKKTLKFFGKKNLGVSFRINSKIPLGKGMASSTADIGAASLATALALGEKISLQEIAKIALSIEPTDGTLFNGIVIFDHRNGVLFKFLGKTPDMEILVIDLGGRVDTLEFNKKDLTRINQEREEKVGEALKLVEEGIREKNPGLIAKGATISAFNNQKILYKPVLDRIWEISQDAGALGINIAHSGTVVGILAEPSKVNFKELKNSLQTRGIGEVFYKTKIVNDGLQTI
jgi:L-threonine kinase